jgi:integrase
VTLGKYPYLSLQEARTKRHELKKAQIDGRSIQEVLNPPKAPVFEEVAKEWYARNMEGKRSESHLRDIRRMLSHYLFPALGARPIAEISAPELLQTLHRIQDLSYIVLMHKVKQIAGQIFQYAVLTGRAAHNVAADLKGALQPIRHKHHPSLTVPKDVAGLMKKIDAYPTPVIRLAMLFSAYTFQRPTEIREAEWSEFDLDAAEWRVPPDRMKRGRTHMVPLSRQVLDILRQARILNELNNTGNRFVFPSPFLSLSWKKEQTISNTAVRTALLAMGYEKGTMTPHGFRSLASTNLNAQGVDKELVEIQLSHRDEDHIRAAYNFADRLPERKVMMQNWADWLDSLYK